MIKVSCSNCNVEFLRYEKDAQRSKSGRQFCSSSCACTYNNKLYVKRKAKKKCQCGKTIRPSCKQCQDCHYLTYLLENKTLGEATSHRQGCSKYINIRKAARKKYLRSDKPKQCAVCSYSHHFEVSHVKAICDYELTAMVSEINDIANLVALCPTHHWELDNGILQVGQAGFEPATCTVMSRPL